VTEAPSRGRPRKTRAARSGEPRGAHVPVATGSITTESEKALAFLARLAMEFTAVLNLSDLLEHVTRVLREETGFDSCAVSLLARQETEDVLIVRAASGLREIMKGAVLPRGRGLSWTVIDSGVPLLVPDMEAEPRWFLKDPLVRSSIWAPMVVQRRAIGVLSAFRSAVNAFTEADLDLLTVVARYLAGAVEVARLHEQLKEIAATDSLTGLANRRTFIDRLQSEISRSRRARSELSIVLLDLNHFKTVNDVHGHAVGDQVLMRVAETLSQSVRQSDVAARFGGDEFILLIPESNRAEAAEILARLRGLSIVVPDRAGSRGRITFSWGLATWPHDGEEIERLLQVADHRLYAMKRAREIPNARPASERLTSDP
jgi:diguanylate cyclase (GGDEF)-like protein